MFIALAAAAVAAATGLHRFDSVARSPSGDFVAAVESMASPDAAAPDAHGSVVVRSAAGAVVRRFDPCAKCTYGAPAWSPDGQRLAFVVTDPAASTATLTVATGATLKALASLRGVAQTPRWSPDGSRLALLAVEGATKATGAVEAGAPQVGEIGEKNDEQRIAVVPAAGGPLRMLSPADTFVYEYDWIPDGTGFVATAARGNGDNNWWVAKLVAIDAGGAVRTIAAPAYQMNLPRVSPDGRTVAFIGGLMSDFGAIGGDLYTVPLAGGVPVDVTPGMKATVTSLHWRGPAPIVVRLVADRTDIARVTLNGAAATLTPLWSAPATLTAGDGDIALSDDGVHVAAAREDFEHPVEIVAGAIAGDTLALDPITHENSGLTPPGVATSIKWRSEGRDVQGWLLAPAATAGATTSTHTTLPMIVIPHGGPSSAVTPTFPWTGVVRQLVDHGYFVFQPNPRGSYGQGEAFTRANIKDFGGGDLRDILAGVAAAEKADARIDGARLGMFGHSYGGFMTMWTVTHSTRFKAAVAGAGIANWISYYGQNGIDQWMIPFFGASAYETPAVYQRASPITTIKAAKTPTLIYVGERDLECPAAQSVEFWHGLKEYNVPTSLIIYPAEGHHLRKPSAIYDREARTLAWFDKYLK